MNPFLRRTIGAIVVVAVVGLCWSLFSATAKDETASAEKSVNVGGGYVVLDMNRILQTADAAKDIATNVEAKRKEYQSQITKVEEDLRSFETSVMKEKDKLTKEEMEKKRKEFEKKMSDAQKLVQDKKNILDQAFSQSMDKLRAEVLKIVAEQAGEKKLKAVFAQEAVILVESDLNITEDILKLVNEKVKKIPVVWSAAKDAK